MKVQINPAAIRQAKWQEYAARFAFGAGITGLAGILAKKFGPGVGGLFLAFPAIFPATATLIEKHEKEKKQRAGFDATKRGRLAAGMDAAGAASGSLGLFLFAVVVWHLTPFLNEAVVLSIATAIWFGIGYFVWRLRKTRPRSLRRSH